MDMGGALPNCDILQKSNGFESPRSLFFFLVQDIISSVMCDMCDTCDMITLESTKTNCIGGIAYAFFNPRQSK